MPEPLDNPVVTVAVVAEETLPKSARVDDGCRIRTLFINTILYCQESPRGVKYVAKNVPLSALRVRRFLVDKKISHKAHTN